MIEDIKEVRGKPSQRKLLVKEKYNIKTDKEIMKLPPRKS